MPAPTTRLHDLMFNGRPCTVNRGSFLEYYPHGAPKTADRSVIVNHRERLWHEILWIDTGDRSYKARRAIR